MLVKITHQFPELPVPFTNEKFYTSQELYFPLIRYLDPNYLSSGRESEGWTLEGGYPPEVDKDTYPRRAMSAGTRAGLVILMRAFKQDLDYICRGPVQGFKVY